MNNKGLPSKKGLYDPSFEHDSCGIGMVANIKGRKSYSIVEQALTVLKNLEHRGACGCEPNTGDGAGILLQKPDKFLRKICSQSGFELPPEQDYGVGMVFLSPSKKDRNKEIEKFNSIVFEEGLSVIGWRDVPTDNSSLGETAKACEPRVKQVFIKREDGVNPGLDFERKLYVIRKRAEKEIRLIVYNESERYFYISSLSSKVLVYKGMLTPWQLELYYPELSDSDMETAIALVHSRFSTNTFPSWHRAHPYRYLIHNGEINTLRGNINWMHAREAMFESELFGDDIKKLFPVISPDGSDSQSFDECLEFLFLAGRPIEHCVMMMIPEPWSNHETMSDEKKAFYEYHACMMEPWDGPASIAFTDGEKVGAVLDRNGLRPTRYYVTKDDRVILASEVGVLDIPPEDVEFKGRLQPGRMLLIDTKEGRIVGDEELKNRLSFELPYREWINRNLIKIDELDSSVDSSVKEYPRSEMLKRLKAFGYTFEDLRKQIVPMAHDGVEPVAAMGKDSPFAVLSDMPQLLYSYFRQLFAQVTNPPIDAIREEIITDTKVWLGAQDNILDPTPEICKRIELPHPILSNKDINRLKALSVEGFKTVTFPIFYDHSKGGSGLKDALDELFEKVDRAIDEGANIIILSDKGFDEKLCPIPALLAVSGLHHHLIRNGKRMRVSIVVESAEPRETHHMATLIGYGASAINPYMAYEAIGHMIREGELTGVDLDTAISNYIKSLVKGVVKIMSKMGISTVQSYHGAQIFEALGLNHDFVDKYFTWTPSRIEGIGMEEVAEETKRRYEAAFPKRDVDTKTLEPGGVHQWRRVGGERHMYNPFTVHKLQYAARNNDYQAYKEFSKAVNDEERNFFTIRGLLDFNFSDNPVPLDEVESVDSICRRFKTGAMSYGAISKEAHEALAIAMNRIGGKSNTGEGGEDPQRFKPDPNGDLRRSAIKQVASGRFGVTIEYLVNSDEIQIKIAQGAKPGEGGQLPGKKVYPWIAKTRLSTPGVGLISPPPHHDIYSIEDLAELIYDLKNSNPGARINVKLVSEVGVGTIAAGVAKGHADVILISGTSGGTGASPRSSIHYAGLPWELGIAETHQTLLVNNLRSRVVLETDGQLKTGRDVAIAALLGAEEWGFSTAPLIVLGCIMMRVCHLDTCPVGVATQNPELRKRFTGDPAHVVNYMRFVAQELREYMAKLGFRTVNEMVGRTDKLRVRNDIDHWKVGNVNPQGLLYKPEVPDSYGTYCQIEQDHGIEKSLDMTVLWDICKPAIESGEKVEATLPIRNINRTVGTIIGSEITKRFGANTLPEDTIKIHFRGSAGQSFGAFLPHCMTFMLEGDANDYIGKGLSGGKIIVYPPKESTFKPEENIIVGNVAFYGATGGEAYIRGMAGERFCVRNSGVRAVVEAVGDHGCEYMTGGRVVVLGPTGRNFAAGMSGGIAYVYDEKGDFPVRCNMQMVSLEELDDEDLNELRNMIEKHLSYTESAVAKSILDDWSESCKRFVKVMPNDYKRMLETIKRVKERGITGEEALMVAFEENLKDLARISGN